MLAPTGTIAFLMDCDTTGVEPDIALVKYKLLAGGGMLKIVNRTVPPGAASVSVTTRKKSSASSRTSRSTTRSKTSRKTARPSRSGLKPEHLPVFDCAFKPYRGKRSIQYMAHLKMMARGAAVHQRRDFQDRQHAERQHRGEIIRDAYVAGLEDGPEMRGDLSRRLEALAAAEHQEDQRRRRQAAPARSTCWSSGLNWKRASWNWNRNSTSRAANRCAAACPTRARRSPTSFDIAGHEGYLTVGLFEDGQPGELFITMAKEGSTIGGLMDTIGTLTSMALQYGVPLEAW